MGRCMRLLNESATGKALQGLAWTVFSFAVPALLVTCATKTFGALSIAACIVAGPGVAAFTLYATYKAIDNFVSMYFFAMQEKLGQF